jgi:hypothetical protein
MSKNLDFVAAMRALSVQMCLAQFARARAVGRRLLLIKDGGSQLRSSTKRRCPSERKHGTSQRLPVWKPGKHWAATDDSTSGEIGCSELFTDQMRSQGWTSDRLLRAKNPKKPTPSSASVPGSGVDAAVTTAVPMLISSPSMHPGCLQIRSRPKGVYVPGVLPILARPDQRRCIQIRLRLRLIRGLTMADIHRSFLAIM